MKYLNLSVLRSRCGLSIIELLVSSAILGITIGALGKVILDSGKAQMFFQQSSSRSQLKAHVLSYLSCQNTACDSGFVEVRDSRGRVFIANSGTPSKYGGWSLRANCAPQHEAVEILATRLKSGGTLTSSSPSDFAPDPFTGQIYTWSDKEAKLFEDGIVLCAGPEDPPSSQGGSGEVDCFSETVEIFQNPTGTGDAGNPTFCPSKTYGPAGTGPTVGATYHAFKCSAFAWDTGKNMAANFIPVANIADQQGSGDSTGCVVRRSAEVNDPAYSDHKFYMNYTCCAVHEPGEVCNVPGASGACDGGGSSGGGSIGGGSTTGGSSGGGVSGGGATTGGSSGGGSTTGGSSGGGASGGGSNGGTKGGGSSGGTKGGGSTTGGTFGGGSTTGGTFGGGATTGGTFGGGATTGGVTVDPMTGGADAVGGAGYDGAGY